MNGHGDDPDSPSTQPQNQTIVIPPANEADVAASVDDEREYVPNPDEQEQEQDYMANGDPNEMKRVKVYELVGSRWVDRGTAFCFGHLSDDGSEALLTARSEKNVEEVILSTTIRATDVYQRQQETLIVWTEPDGVDFALSFQDAEGCAEVWSFIVDVQRHMTGAAEENPHTNPPGSITLESSAASSSSPLPGLSDPSSAATATIMRTGHLPTPHIGVLGDIDKAIKILARTQPLKEKICEYIQNEEYIKQLVDVLHQAEEAESLENLHALCGLMQTILMLNDHGIYEQILEDEYFLHVCGMLEYDPDFPTHKANYRTFLLQGTRFHEPIPIRDLSIQRKIHHTYRLQFLKDVVLARVLDDSTFNVLNGCIIFNQIDIIQHVQGDNAFLRDIVKLYVDEDMLSGGRRQQGQQAQMVNGHGDEKPNGLAQHPLLPPHPQPTSQQPTQQLPYAFSPPSNLSPSEIQHRRSVIFLIHQLCVMGKNVQLPARLALFRNLVDRGVLFGVQWAMGVGLGEGVEVEGKAEAGDVKVEEEKTKLGANCNGTKKESDSGEINGTTPPSLTPTPAPAPLPLHTPALEILSSLLDHDLNGVRGHVLKQVVAIEKERLLGKKGAEEAETLLEMCCRILAGGARSKSKPGLSKMIGKSEIGIGVEAKEAEGAEDIGVIAGVGEVVRAWIEVPLGLIGAGNMGMGGAGGGGDEKSHPHPQTRKDDPGTERFLEYFYKDCINILFKPFWELPDWKEWSAPIIPLTRPQTTRFVYLCDMLYNFNLQHSFRSHYYTLSTNVLVKVATLLKAKDKHLRHASFRIFRLLLKQNNPTTMGHLIKSDIFKPILDLTIQESRRDNLLSCSCQEFWECMRRENMKEQINYCMTRYPEEIKTLAESPLGGQRFQLFMRRWEMNNEPMPVEVKPEKLTDPRGWPMGSREEEDYFNGDDEDDDEEEDLDIDIDLVNMDQNPNQHSLMDDSNFVPSISQSWSRGTGASSPIPGPHGLKRKRRMAVAGALASASASAGVGTGMGGTKGGTRMHQRHPSQTQIQLHMQSQQPQQQRQRSPSLGPLVDYDDEDSDEGGAGTGTDTESISIDVTNASPSEPQEQGSSSSASTSATPSSPKLSHRKIPISISIPTSPSSSSLSPSLNGHSGPPPKRLAMVNEEDEEDNMLEALVSRSRSSSISSSRPQSPAPGMMASLDSLGPMRPSEKRRRGDYDGGDEDEDDEELLERLSKRSSKKVDLGVGKAMLKQKQMQTQMSSGTITGAGGGLGTNSSLGGGGGIPTISLLNRSRNKNKTGDDPPAKKKFQVKIGTKVLAPVSTLTTMTTKTTDSNSNPTTPTSASTPIPKSTPTPISVTTTTTPAPSEPGAKDGDTG